MDNFLTQALSGYSDMDKQPQKKEQPKKEVGETLPVKIVALEVLKQVKLNLITEYIALGGIFLVMLLGTLNRMFGIYAGFACVIPLVIFLAKDTKQKVYLTNKYIKKDDKGGARI